MKFQMSQPIESTTQLNPDEQPNEPTENMAAPFLEKAHAHEMHEKAGSISDTCVRVTMRGDMKKSLSTKPGWDEPPPCEALDNPDAHHHDCYQL